jgi:hypothetical protein
MEKIRKIYCILSPLPLVLFGLISIYISQFEGWGAWAAGPMLILPIILSFMMGLWGIHLTWQAKREEVPDGKLLLATLLAGSLAIWILIKLPLMEIQRSFF